ncbi:hypothetical protein PYW07_002053 [Mythimna separata]|uniref:Uncharacterized protein n=1 Tax=Mythimna separata TaxID=271217 RepID=A0AAD7YMJ4_MYTSE|nr:hypothetical protein PYW07_002053 [Mythimna separata]
MSGLLLVFLIIYPSLHQAFRIAVDKRSSQDDKHFDTVVFAQEWPVTVCKFWMEGLEDQCVYPKQKNRWTVHGIWPRKAGVDYVNFCNTGWNLNPEEIKSLETNLLQAWSGQFLGNTALTYVYWNHEWFKHGTCGVALEPLNSQSKYFSKAIEWNEKYSIADMLDAANILPDDTKEYNPEVFVNAVKAKTGKSAMMGCFLIEGVVYVQELRICFDKQFNLVDCDEPAVDKDCKSSKGVIFPANALV